MQVTSCHCAFVRATLVALAILGVTACGSSAPTAATATPLTSAPAAASPTLPPTPSPVTRSSPTTAPPANTPTAVASPTTPATPTIVATPTTLAALPTARATTPAVVIKGPTAAAGQVEICAVTVETAQSVLGATVVPPRFTPYPATPDPRHAACSYTMTDGTVLYVSIDNGDGQGINKGIFVSLKKRFPDAHALSGVGDDAFQKPGSVWVLKGEKFMIISTSLKYNDPEPPGPYDDKLPALAKAAAARL